MYVFNGIMNAHSGCCALKFSINVENIKFFGYNKGADVEV